MYKKMIHFPVVMLYLETMTPSCHELLIHLSHPGINSVFIKYTCTIVKINYIVILVLNFKTSSQLIQLIVNLTSSIDFFLS
jgi:hypothetical protein